METIENTNGMEALATQEEKIKIFLVDDDKMFTTALHHSLSKAKDMMADIKSFSTGEECIQHLGDAPEVVILDYYLNKDHPDAMNGIEVLKQIKKTYPDTEVIILSSQDNINVAMDTIKYGAYEYIAKGGSAFVRIKNEIRQIHNKMELHHNMNKENIRFRRISMVIVVVLLVLLLLSIII